MDDNIHKAAIGFKELMSYEYKFVIGAKGKSTEIALRFDEHNFHHLCGLHKLRDVLEPNINRAFLFNEILNGSISDAKLSQSKYYISEGVESRIKCVAELPKLLENLERVYKYNNRANPISKIKGDALFKWSTCDGRNIYFVMKSNIYMEGKFLGLSIFSNAQSERDFAIGHTPNTLLYVSKTPLTGDKELDKSKEIVLYQLPSYNPPSNINIVTFSRLPDGIGNAAVLAAPRPSFGQAFANLGQALANLINKWADKIKENVKMRRELKSAKEEIAELKQDNSELKQELSECKSNLAEKDKEIAASHKRETDLIVEIFKQKELLQAANPTKPLPQKLAEAEKKCRERNARNPLNRKPPDKKHPKL